MLTKSLGLKCSREDVAVYQGCLTLGFAPKFFSISNSSERYGFAHLLSDRVGMRFRRRLFSVNWQHGLYSHVGSERILSYLPTKTSRSQRDLVVVGNAMDARFVRSNGYENVIAAGLPFAYVPPSIHQRRQILLAFPGHSAEASHERIDVDLEYLVYLRQFKDYFKQIWISVYGLDAHQAFYRKAREMGFTTVLGAHPSDSRSLERSRAAMDSVSHVTTNTIGSHLFYALYAGCRVSVCGPYFAYQNMGDGSIVHKKCSEELLLESCLYGGQFEIDEVSGLFAESPLHGVCNIDLGKKAIGVDHLIYDSRVLRAIMRWGIGDQIQGYFAGVARRASRYAKRSLLVSGLS